MNLTTVTPAHELGNDVPFRVRRRNSARSGVKHLWFGSDRLATARDFAPGSPA